jgi:hypothetical protein
MSDRATSSHPHHTANFSKVVATVVPAVLFAAIMLFAILVSLRYAHGWANVASEGAAVAIPIAIDGLVAIVSALTIAGGAVWFYVTRLVR